LFVATTSSIGWRRYKRETAAKQRTRLKNA
jgi:hypothetical protein